MPDEPSGVLARRKLERQLREMNEALLVSSVHQHELTGLAQDRERALQASEDRYRVLFGALPVAAFVCDRDAVIQYYNPRAIELWGREPKTGVERHCGSVKLILPDGTLLPHVQSPMMDVLRTGTPCRNVELSIERPDGSRLPVVVNFCALRDAQGDIAGVVTSFDDVSERKRAEEALRESEERFRNLADNIPQLAWIANAGTDGQVHWFNQNWYEYTGTTLEEMNGSGWKTVHHPEHIEAVAKKFEHHVKEGLDWEDTFPLRGKDGQYRWFLSRMKVIHDDSGKAMRIFGTNTDVTQQRQMADELRRLAGELTDLHRRKDEFLAMLSHELRNPLAPIANAVYLLRLQPDEGPLQRQARTIIEHQVTQLTRLIDDLMEVSRITTGRVQLRLERVAVNGIVERAVETACPLIEQHHHELTVSLSPDPIWLDADAARLEQVIVNLLTNAAKYTPDRGRISLSVELASRERERPEECVIRVSDTGVGIAPELLPRIFDLFTQAERSLDRSQGGLGIGLALVQRLVELHEGRVDVISVLGQGSEFVVRLPLADCRLPIEKEQGNTNRQSTIDNRHSLRVLVVDDNVDAAEMLAEL